MIHIDRSIIVSRSSGLLFEILSDPLRFPVLFPGISRVELVSPQGRCTGARYLVLMRVGHIDAGGIQTLTEFKPPRRMAFESEGGIRVSGSVSMTPIDTERTDVRLAFDYEVPGLRWAARAVERLTRHNVDRRVQAILLSIKRIAEFDLDGLGRALAEQSGSEPRLTRSPADGGIAPSPR